VVSLALDTTTRSGSVAVLRDDHLLALVHGDASRTHGERLPGEIDRAVRNAQIALRSVELLVVATGPGAFTGLRIGLAAVQGLAMVLGVPVIGVSALDALALAVSERQPERPLTVSTWVDAQRGEVFAATHHWLQGGALDWRSTEPIVAAPAAVLADMRASQLRPDVFVGDAASRHADLIRAEHDVPLHPAPDALAPYLGRLGQARARRGEAGPPHALQPLYVRRPDAELERERGRTRDA
jgi:tRNA threonylcarbamoyladenosine biosynthesis protein TsaB